MLLTGEVVFTPKEREDERAEQDRLRQLRSRVEHETEELVKVKAQGARQEAEKKERAQREMIITRRGYRRQEEAQKEAIE